MPTLRTVIFIDGANFRSNLRNFSFRSDPPHPDNPDYRLEERHFHWPEFFQAVIGKLDVRTGWRHQLIRAYWYHARSIVPWSAPPYLVQRVIERNPEIPGLTADEVIRLAKNWYDRERDYFERLRETTFENIQREANFLEFKYVGQYVVRPFSPYRLQVNPVDNSITYLGTQQGEKGVDLGIAVDMIAKMPNYDAAILISGDADFLPVVGYLKDNLKYVYQFSLAKGVPPSIRYLSPWLKGLVDCFESFDENEFLSRFLNRRANIPPAILDAIDQRIASLASPATDVP